MIFSTEYIVWTAKTTVNIELVYNQALILLDHQATSYKSLKHSGSLYQDFLLGDSIRSTKYDT